MTNYNDVTIEMVGIYRCVKDRGPEGRTYVPKHHNPAIFVDT